MGRMVFSRRDSAIVARHEVPGLQFGHLERGTRDDSCPEGGYRGSDLTIKVTLLSQYLGDTPG